jgi:hypothetical protein
VSETAPSATKKEIEDKPVIWRPALWKILRRFSTKLRSHTPTPSAQLEPRPGVVAVIASLIAGAAASDPVVARELGTSVSGFEVYKAVSR